MLTRGSFTLSPCTWGTVRPVIAAYIPKSDGKHTSLSKIEWQSNPISITHIRPITSPDTHLMTESLFPSDQLEAKPITLYQSLADDWQYDDCISLIGWTRAYYLFKGEMITPYVGCYDMKLKKTFIRNWRKNIWILHYLVSSSLSWMLLCC